MRSGAGLLIRLPSISLLHSRLYRSRSSPRDDISAPISPCTRMHGAGSAAHTRARLDWRALRSFVGVHLRVGLTLKSPSAAGTSRSNMAPSGGTGLGGLPGAVNAQLKMNIRREINAACERFPSYLKTEWLASYGG